jgi:hypothetical protein
MEARNFSTEIERMVRNYTVMGFLDDKQYDIIMKVIDAVLPKPTLKRDGNIIYLLTYAFKRNEAAGGVLVILFNALLNHHALLWACWLDSIKRFGKYR